MECPKCDAEMYQETAISDSWDYGSDRHRTTETLFWVCSNKECKHEIEDTGDEE